MGLESYGIRHQSVRANSKHTQMEQVVQYSAGDRLVCGDMVRLESGELSHRLESNSSYTS